MHETIAPKPCPQVVQIWGYSNPKALLTSDEEFIRLIKRFENVQCTSIAKFIEGIQIEEKEHKVAMSYNFTLLPPNVDLSKNPSLEDVMAAMRQRDLLVGTRRGDKSAITWLTQFADSMTDADHGALQFADGIFAQALTYFSSTRQTTSLEEMAAVAFGDISAPTVTPTQKH
jgi:hypothetical protein